MQYGRMIPLETLTYSLRREWINKKIINLHIFLFVDINSTDREVKVKLEIRV